MIEIGEEDVRRLDEMLGKFDEIKKGLGGGLPDYSPDYVAYFPVLALALLKSQHRLERLTWCIIGLTAILGVLTFVMVFR